MTIPEAIVWGIGATVAYILLVIFTEPKRSR